MQQKGISPDIVSYNSVIDGCSKNDRIDESIKYFQFLLQNKIEPTTETYNSLIDGCGKNQRLLE
eukprot:Pgem_evm1s18026